MTIWRFRPWFVYHHPDDPNHNHDPGWDIDLLSIRTGEPSLDADAAWWKLAVLTREDGKFSLRLLTWY